ncbi:unnamed protein product [Phyllotreta striolata]|uniref:Aspartate aminotransferase n=1 Tax=Phyllotreta striolata TaxID=444603 RepID=A0A9N9TQE4_PHYSR|nr:unnamed protein product [Phyllotreta striolata]
MFIKGLLLRNKLKPKLLRECLVCRNVGWFANIPMGEKDPIFGILDAFLNDTNPSKVNLSIGIFRTDDNKPFVLECVRKAEKIIISKNLDKEYCVLLGGSPAFQKHNLDYTLGPDCEYNQPGRNICFQSLSGCGALSMVSQFLSRFFPGRKVVYMSDPTWPNHANVLESMGLETAYHRYYDAETVSLDFCGMMEDIHKIPKRSMILFQSIAHNPTGFDPTPEQWNEIAEEVKKRKLYAIVDNAYQGFASGDSDKDAQSFRILAKHRVKFALCNSFSKSLGLYGERIGSIIFLTDSQDEVQRIYTQFIPLTRANYQNPPLHGRRIVEEVFTNPELSKIWKKEVVMMAGQLKNVRQLLVQNLKEAGSKRNWDFFTTQIGMFSYTGLSPQQIERLSKEFHIYMLRCGRLAIPGLTTKNVAYVAKCLHKVTSE